MSLQHPADWTHEQFLAHLMEEHGWTEEDGADEQVYAAPPGELNY